MADQNERNGRDRETLEVLVPIEKTRQRPVDLREPTDRARAVGTDLQRAIFDAIVQLVPAVNENTSRCDDTFAQVIVLSKAFNELAKALGKTREKVASQHDGIADASQKVEHAAEKVGEAVDKLDDFVEEHTSPGTRIETDSQRFARHTKLRETAEKASKWDQLVAANENEATKTKDAWRALRYTVAGGIILVVLLAIGGFVYHATTVAAVKALDDQKAQVAHDNGVSEGKASAPVMLVPIPAPPSSLEPAITMPAANGRPGRHP